MADGDGDGMKEKVKHSCDRVFLMSPSTVLSF